MSLLRRNYIGLSIVAGELRAVSLQRKGRRPVLVGGRLLSLPEGLWQASPHVANISERNRFVARLKEVLQPLAKGEKRIALSLPANCGRILLREAEQSFKSKAEGIEVLKWQLKQSLPGNGQAVNLDFQRLDYGESGRQRFLIAALSRLVLEQYEDALQEAGYHGSIIGMQPLHLGQFYHRRLATEKHPILVSVEGDELSLQCYQDQQLLFCRQRIVARDAEAVFRELNRSMSAVVEGMPAFSRARVFLHSDWEDQTGLLDAVKSAFTRDLSALRPGLEQMATQSLSLPEWRVRGLAGAVGAAMQML